MSGEDSRSRARAKGGRAAFDDAAAPVGPVPVPMRPWKAKPPPGIITAGGVDMARGHASGVIVREASAPVIAPDEPRVVLAVETDPRKVPTHRRVRDLAPAGEAPARPALLPAGTATDEGAPAASPNPEANPPAAPPREGSAAAGPPATAAEDDKVPLWLRAALAVILVFFVIGLWLKVRARAAAEHLDARGSHAAPYMPDAPDPLAVVPPPRPPPPAAAPAAAVVSAPLPASPPPSAEPPRRPARAPASKPAFTPPFQLPSEKN